MTKKVAHKRVLLCFLVLYSTTASYSQVLNNGKIIYDLESTLQTKNIQLQTAISKTQKELTYKKDSNITTVTSMILTVPLEKYGEFIAFGLSVSYDQHNGELNAQVRSSADIKNWDRWITLSQIDLIEEESNLFRSELYFFEKNVRYIQFKISSPLAGIDSLLLNNISLFFSSPLPNNEKEPENKLQLKSTDTLDLSIEEFARPNFVHRKEWGCPQEENSTDRDLTTVTHLVIHHSAGANSASDYEAVVLSYWDYHVNGNGWADIGYNWLVDPNGVIYKGRAWYDEIQENVKGAHNSGKNSGTTGMCLIGNYTEDVSPSTDMWEAAWDMLAFLCDKYSLDPLGVSYHTAIDQDNDVIDGHRDSGGGTVCPGDIAYSYEAIRQAVADKLSGTYTQGPVDLSAQTHDCSNKSVQFSWESSGTGWQINVSEDPLFSSHYVKWVSDLTTYTGPVGFVLSPDGTESLENFKDDTRYFWRIYYQNRKSPTYSYTMPYCGPSSVPETEKNEFSYRVYPNPSNGLFHVKLANSTLEGYRVSMINLAGQKVFETESTSKEITIDQQGLSTGIYFLKIETNNSVEIAHVLVQK